LPGQFKSKTDDRTLPNPRVGRAFFVLQYLSSTCGVFYNKAADASERNERDEKCCSVRLDTIDTAARDHRADIRSTPGFSPRSC
jgi:hypothetical protein